MRGGGDQEKFVLACELLGRYSMEDFDEDIWFDEENQCAYLVADTVTFMFYRKRYVKEPCPWFDPASTLIRVPRGVYHDFKQYMTEMLLDALDTFVTQRDQFSHLVAAPWHSAIPWYVLKSKKK